MKKLILLLLLSTAFLSRAQLSNIVVYTELGERFSVSLNGVMQNNIPSNNIRLTGIMPGSYQMAMMFEIQALGTVNWNLIVEPSTEASYCARRLPSGEWMVRLLSVVPAMQVVNTVIPNQSTIIYHSAPLGGTTTTTTTTYYEDPLYYDDWNINLGINGNGVQMNVGGNFTETTTTQTTYVSPGFQQTIIQSPLVPGQVLPAQPLQPAPSYAPAGCNFAMDPVSFSEARNSISSKNFESSKLQVARQITQARCLTAAQVRDIMRLFSFESSRLEFAKFAYPYTFDANNYFVVNDAFGFSSSIDDLNRFLQNRR